MTEGWLYGIFLAFIPLLVVLISTRSPALAGVAFTAATTLFVPLAYYLDTAWRKKKFGQLQELGDAIVDKLENFSRAVQTPEESVQTAQYKSKSPSRTKSEPAPTQGPELEIPEDELSSEAQPERTRSRV